MLALVNQGPSKYASPGWERGDDVDTMRTIISMATAEDNLAKKLELTEEQRYRRYAQHIISLMKMTLKCAYIDNKPCRVR